MRQRISPGILARASVMVCAWGAGLLAAGSSARAAATFSIAFDDPGSAHSAYYGQIQSNLQAAGADWARYLDSSAQINLTVAFSSNIGTANGASDTTGFVANDGTRNIFEQGAAYKLRTGTNPAGAANDATITIGDAYLADNLWFDPNPLQRTDPIPPNRTDAVSVLIHELAHVFVFNGWRDSTTGDLPATYMSTFDQQTAFDGTNFYFTGPQAQQLYGGPVPLTFGNAFHFGNFSPRPGADLIGDLMNGVVFDYSTRYDISPLDLAVFQDAGVAVVPEPAALILLPLVYFALRQRRHAARPDAVAPASASAAPSASPPPPA